MQRPSTASQVIELLKLQSHFCEQLNPKWPNGHFCSQLTPNRMIETLMKSVALEMSHHEQNEVIENYPSIQHCIGIGRSVDYRCRYFCNHTALYSLFRMSLHHRVGRNDDLRVKMKSPYQIEKSIQWPKKFI